MQLWITASGKVTLQMVMTKHNLTLRALLEGEVISDHVMDLVEVLTLLLYF